MFRKYPLALLLIASAAVAQISTEPSSLAGPKQSSAAPEASGAPAAQTAGTDADAGSLLASVSGAMLQRRQGEPSFHIKMDLTGKSGTPPTEQTGTYEELWVDPEHWKHTVDMGNGVRAELIRLDGSLYKLTPADTAHASWPPVSQWMQPQFPAAISHPIQQNVEISGTKLIRIGEATVPLEHPVVTNKPAWYLTPDSHRLVAITQAGAFVTYSKFGKIAGKDVATAFSARQSNGASFSGTATLFEANVKATAADFAIPEGAKKVDPSATVRLASGVIAGRRIGGNPVAYPAQAKINNEQGTVVIEAVVTEEGHIRDPKIVASPGPDLSRAALEAVSTYIYRPYLIDGNPVEVTTTINVTFRLN